MPFSPPIPADNARIDFILTKNPRYANAKGIRSGSLLQDAVSAYGSVRLYYSPDVEYAQFQGQPYNTTSEMGFWVAAPQGKPSAGVYKWINLEAGDCETAESGFCESTSFHPGSKISYISVASTSN